MTSLLFATFFLIYGLAWSIFYYSCVLVEENIERFEAVDTEDSNNFCTSLAHW